jgi:hypothetical protein
MGEHVHTRVRRIVPVGHPSSEGPTSARAGTPTRTERILREDSTYCPSWRQLILTIVRQPTGPIEATLCDYETIESVNDVLYDQLHELVQMPFFKYFRVRQPTLCAS